MKEAAKLSVVIITIITTAVTIPIPRPTIINANTQNKTFGKVNFSFIFSRTYLQYVKDTSMNKFT